MAEIPTKPYLLRAIHSWCEDSGYRPYLAVVVDERTHVPREFVRNGEIVLNVSSQATHRLRIGNELIEFEARFSGTVRSVSIPIENVSAIYAQETGHGMAFDVVRSPAAHAAASVVSSSDGRDALEPIATGSSPELAVAPAPAPASASPSDERAASESSAAVAPRRIGARPKLVPKPPADRGKASVGGESPTAADAPVVEPQPRSADEPAPLKTDSQPRKPARGGRRRPTADASPAVPSEGQGGAAVVSMGPATERSGRLPEPPEPSPSPGTSPSAGRPSRGHLKRVK